MEQFNVLNSSVDLNKLVIQYDTSGDSTIYDYKSSDNLNFNNCNLDTFYWHYWYPYLYPTTTIIQEDKTKKAFEIAKELMLQKLIKCNTVKQFVDLVDILLKKL